MWGTFLSLSYIPTPALPGSGYMGMISACPSNDGLGTPFF